MSAIETCPAGCGRSADRGDEACSGCFADARRMAKHQSERERVERAAYDDDAGMDAEERHYALHDGWVQ